MKRSLVTPLLMRGGGKCKKSPIKQFSILFAMFTLIFSGLNEFFIVKKRRNERLYLLRVFRNHYIHYIVSLKIGRVLDALKPSV